MNGGVRTKPCAFSGCFIPVRDSPRTGLQGSNIPLWREARGFARFFLCCWYLTQLAASPLALILSAALQSAFEIPILRTGNTDIIKSMQCMKLHSLFAASAIGE